MRSKLLVSYIVVIGVCLTLVGALGVFWVQRYEREAALTQVRLAAQSLDHLLEALPASEERIPAVLVQYLRSEAFATEATLLFLDADGFVLRAEPAGPLDGQRVFVPSPADFRREEPRFPLRRWTSVSGKAGTEGARFFLLFVPLPERMDAGPPQPSVHFVALAVPTREVERPWREWLPPLVGIGGVAVILSALVSYLVFGSITRPIAAMTRAAEEMAGGQYEHHIPVNSDDEVGRLAAAFNRMALEVERAQRAQRDFMVNISHDLQTPLTSIRGFSQAIVDGAVRDVEGLRRAGKIIHEEAQHMREIVGALLDLTRLEAGQFEMARIPVDLSYVLRAAAARFASRAREANISLTWSLPDSLPPILGDSERLSQVFVNLLDNAIKYTPADGQITIEGYMVGGANDRRRSSNHYAMAKGPREPTEGGYGNGELPLLHSGQWVVISVSDTGIGIGEEELSRIFERFYRGDKARTGQEGTGLGLSIAREIVQAHGGQITVSSQLGRGTQFHVALPVSGVQTK